MTVHCDAKFLSSRFARGDEEFTDPAENGGIEIFGLLPVRIDHALSSRIAASVYRVAVTASIPLTVKEWHSGLQGSKAARLADLYVGGKGLRGVSGRAMAVCRNPGPGGPAQKLV